MIVAPNPATAENSTAIGNFRHITEASTLGIPPGQWAERINTAMGNGQPFLWLEFAPGGAMLYRQGLGCLELLVAND